MSSGGFCDAIFWFSVSSAVVVDPVSIATRPLSIIDCVAVVLVKPERLGTFTIPFKDDQKPKFSIFNLSRQITKK